MEKDFLHKINISKVLEETGLDMSGLSALLDIEEQTIGRWEKDKAHNGNRPKYNAIIMMLQKGATTKTLFGIDCNPQKELNKLPPIEELINTPEFKAELVKALKKLKDEGF
ncbi:MAG: hypothetical protein IKS96_07085 [Fibrobacter sp.]|nr:hypothetical protein [Fibrobacter sp.]MBR6449691.1 hypothetical protein [Fibrobacter sp.]